jgi:hypothetical protein
MIVEHVCPKCGKKWQLPATAAHLFTCSCGHGRAANGQRGKRNSVVRDPVKEPCVHKGEERRLVECPTCCGGKTKVKVFGCAVHGECSLGAVAGVRGCQSCGDYRPKVDSRQRPPWITTAQLVADTLSLIPQLPPLAGIIGVARSGMLPSSLLAMQLHLPLFTLRQHDRDIVPAGHGFRLEDARRQGRMLVVDDSIASGNTLAIARQIAAAAGLVAPLFAAVITTNPAASDFHARHLACDHLFEWNFFNSIWLPKSGLDFDGLLCEDGHRPEAAPAKHLPRRSPIPLIVTARPENERAATLAWLKRHGVRAQRLVMWPGSLAERERPLAVSRYKAQHYAASGLKWFVESCPVQAREIAQLTGRAVICPTTAEVF